MTLVPVTMKVDLAKELTEELNIEEVFGFDLHGIHIGFDEATVVSWIIMAAMAVLCFFLTRGLKVEGKLSKRQLLLELAYTKGEAFFKDLMGPKIHMYIPWLMSMAVFIGISNIIGMFGMKPPTKSMQTAAAMAVTSIVLIEYCAFKDKGIKGRLRAFTKPVGIVTPIKVLEIFTKPLSLCMRLFGNVLAAFTIMKLIEISMSMILPPVIVPVIFSLYFDIFDGLLQAYIFVFLTALYLEEAVEPIDPPKTKEQKRQEKLAKQERRRLKKEEKQAKKAAKKAA